MALINYTAPTRAIGQAGLTTDLNAAYKQIEALTAAVFDVRRFVSGNGSTVTDAAIVAAIAAMPAGGGKLILPAGLTYALNNPIVVNKAVEIEGQGKASMYRTQKPTNLVVNHTGAAFTFQKSGFTARGFHLGYAGSQTTNPNYRGTVADAILDSKGIVVDIQETVPSEFSFASAYPNGIGSSYAIENVSLFNFGTNLHQINGAEGHISFVDFQGYSQHGLILECRLEPDLGDMSLVGCNFYSEKYHSIAGVAQYSGGGAKFTSCKWNQRDGKQALHGYYAKVNTTHPTGTSILQFVNNSFENIGGTSIKIEQGTAPFLMVTVAGNEFASYNTERGTPVSYVDADGIQAVTIADNTFRKASTSGPAVRLNNCAPYSFGKQCFLGYTDIASAVSIANSTESIQYSATPTGPTGPTYSVTPYTEPFSSTLGIFQDYSAGTGSTRASNGLTLRPGVGVLNQSGANHAAIISQNLYNFVGHSIAAKVDQVISQADPNSVFWLWLGTATYGAAGNIGCAIQNGILYVQFGDAHNFNNSQISYNATTMKYLRLTVASDNASFTGEYSADGTAWTAVPNATNIPLGSVSMARVSAIIWAAQGNNGVDGNTALVSSVQLA